MKVLFLDQSGKLGGAQMSLADTVVPFRDTCLVCLFEEGPFRPLLEQQQVPVHVLAAKALSVRKNSSLVQCLGSLGTLASLIYQVATLSRQYDLIYANTIKAFVVGAIASFISRRPLVYHLRDILSTEHFSRFNCSLVSTLANLCANLVITNSQATQAAFVAAGGRQELTAVVYNGFQPELYQSAPVHLAESREDGAEQASRPSTKPFVIGHFSRLSPWKGQHILLEALSRCPQEVTVVLVGDALFGEQAYVTQLHHQVKQLGLEHRVRFLGFRSDIAALMSSRDLVVHSSTAPEPFGRVIVEAMLCGKPVIAAAAGGAVELIESGETGWLTPPGDAIALAEMINQCRQSQRTALVAHNAQQVACQRFQLDTAHRKISDLLNRVCQPA